MAYVLSDRPKMQYELAPEGIHQGVCVDVIDLGIKQTKFGPKPKVKFVFEIAARRKDGKPFLLFTWPLTASLNEKAELRKMIEKWRGKALTKDELRGFDLEALVGAPAMLHVVHNEGDDTTYANIGGIFKDTNADKYTPSGSYVRQKDKEAEHDDETPF